MRGGEANNLAMRQMTLIASVAVCLALSACGNSNTPVPAAVPGIEPPAAWGAPIRDFIENREGGVGVTVARVLEAELQRYRDWTPTVGVEAQTETSATFILDVSDMRRGKEVAAGVAPDPTLLAAPPDRIRILLEVRPNGPVFVVRTREFDVPDVAPSRGG